jgi:hypothetical protein
MFLRMVLVSSMSDEFDAALACLLEADSPDLSATTFETLAQSLLYQGPHRAHQDENKHSDIQQKESAKQSQLTQ